MSSLAFLKKYLPKLSAWAVVLLLVFIGAIGFFVFLMHEVLWEKEQVFDGRVFALLEPHITSRRTAFMEAVTYCASSTFLQVAYGCTVLFYCLRKNWKRAAEIVVIGIGGFLVNYFMKISFHRLRPPNPVIDPPQNFSFPSGHATSGFIFYGLLVYLVWKSDARPVARYPAIALLVLLALLIGFSRVYLRVHYASDVIAGFCNGAAWLALAIWMMERLKKKAVTDVRQDPSLK
ncbi:MAG: phosphatase family protein [Flaviaesturariibacter sp.]|nr:phosphatase family protein [Flaviaesturariibacter sp.]